MNEIEKKIASIALERPRRVADALYANPNSTTQDLSELTGYHSKRCNDYITALWKKHGFTIGVRERPRTENGCHRYFEIVGLGNGLVSMTKEEPRTYTADEFKQALKLADTPDMEETLRALDMVDCYMNRSELAKVMGIDNRAMGWRLRAIRDRLPQAIVSKIGEKYKLVGFNLDGVIHEGEGRKLEEVANQEVEEAEKPKRKKVEVQTGFTLDDAIARQARINNLFKSTMEMVA